MFQRQWMQGQQRNPSSWKEQQAEASRQWKAMIAEEQDSYIAAATAEQGLRDDAMQEPWKAKYEQGNNEIATIDLLPRNARKVCSKSRVLNSYARFKTHKEWWSQQGSGVFCPDGIMELDSVDVNMRDEDIQQGFATFAELGPELPTINCLPPHHTVCAFGQCVNDKHFSMAAKFVHSMSHFLAKGACYQNQSSY